MVATVAVPPAPLWIHALGAAVHLVAYQGLHEPMRGEWQFYEDDRLVRPPLARLRLQLATGGARDAVVFRSTVGGDDRIAAVRIADGRGSTLAAGVLPPWTGAAQASTFELTDGLGPTQRLRLARFIFGTCAGLFRLGGDARFVGQSRNLLRELVGQPGSLAPRCVLADKYLLYEGRAGGWLGDRLAAWLLTRRGLEASPVPPSCDEHTAGGGRGALLRLLIEADAAGAAEALILGEAGLAWRTLAPARGRIPDAFEWLAAPDQRRAAARGYVIEALGALAAEHDQARAALRELRVLLPAPTTRLALRTAELDAGVDLVVGSATGVLVSGWLSDREGVVDAIRVERAGRTQNLPVRDLDRFARPTVEPAAGRGGECPASGRGFVLFAGEGMAGPGEAPCHVALLLRSGQRLRLAEGPTRHAGGAHAAVLGAVPRAWLTPDLVAKCFEPVVRALAPRRATVDRVLEIGRPPRAPQATVVIAVGDDPDHLRCRYGLFASDPAMRAIEIVHVLDRPERAAGVRRLLEGLAAVYGIGSRLLILSGPGPGGVVLDVAAAITTAATIMFLGPGVVPERHGWLEPILLHLAARRECGVAGGRIVHADDSLCHGGGEFDVTGPEIDLRVPLQGFPRDYETDRTAWRTGVVAPGAFAIRRALLDEIRAFPEGYLGVEFAVAELCLEARSRGLEVWTLGAPTLVELTPLVATPGLDPAQEIDRRLLEVRWGDRLRALGASDATSADPSARGARAAASRWRAA